jgi:hypothetical protein
VSPATYLGWRAPAPLWNLALRDPHLERLQQPAILRFQGDQFVKEFLDLMAGAAPDLAPLAARPETGKEEGAGWLELEELNRSPLLLWQMTQGRSYMAAASLTWLVPGLPEPGFTDAVRLRPASLVMRRLVSLRSDGCVNPANPATYREFCWDPAREGGTWVPAPAYGVLPEEQRFPLFAVPYLGKHRRTLYAGMLPVAQREHYLAAPVDLPDPWPTPDWDPRRELFAATVLEPLGNLVAPADPVIDEPLSTELLLELAAFFAQYLPEAWQQIHFRGEWAARLEQAWAEREQIVAGGPDLAFFNLAGTVLQRDIAGLEAAVTELLAQQPHGVLKRPESPLFVVRFVLEPAKEEPAPTLVSVPSHPFELAAFDQAGAPAGPPGTGGAGLVALAKAVAKLVLPQVKKKRG